MRIKVAEHAMLFYDRGRLVWDDYLHHRQYEVTEVAEWLCRQFTSFTDPQHLLDPLDDEDRQGVMGLVDELVSAGVLLVEGSAGHQEEQSLLDAWASWGSSTRHFHFASRTLRDAPYSSADDQERELNAKLDTGEAPPPPFRRVGRGQVVMLPVPPAAPDWGRQPLADVLLERCTTREFAADPLHLDQVAQLLGTLAGPSPARPRIGVSGTVFKSSPSGGGRHPVELYLHASRVLGLDPGWYHYEPGAHVLEPLAAPWSPEQLTEAAGDQAWVGQAAATVHYTAVLDRTRWKYDTARAYRVVQMDVGHVSQTAYLVATAMGLGVGFTAALRDELVEQVLGVDPHHEIVLGITALGRHLGCSV